MKLSDLRHALQAGDIRLTKSLGQSFLHDSNQLRRIVATAGLTRAERVLEIGPGLGPLTERLLGEAGEVLAIEKDRRLVEFLRERFADTLRSEEAETVASEAGDSQGPLTPSLFPSDGTRGEASAIPSTADAASEDASVTLPPSDGKRDGVRGSTVGARPTAMTPPANKAILRVIQADALEFLRAESRDWADWKLIANPPYSIASPILVELAESPHPPRQMVVTLQLEVAQRLMAGPAARDYGVLTLLIQLRYEPHGWFRIPATCFFPVPKVDSACVNLVRRAKPLLDRASAAVFTRVIKRGFTQRRKMMFKLLKQDWPEDALRAGFRHAGVAESARAESVGLDQFVTLTRWLAGSDS